MIRHPSSFIELAQLAQVLGTEGCNKLANVLNVAAAGSPRCCSLSTLVFVAPPTFVGLAGGQQTNQQPASLYKFNWVLQAGILGAKKQDLTDAKVH